MVKIIEEVISHRFSEFFVECPHCTVLCGHLGTFGPCCEICEEDLPDYTSLMEFLDERILHFEIGELWEEGS